MSCREFIEFLMDYLGGELSETERARFDEHLAVCPACRDYLQNYQTTLALECAASGRWDDPVPASVPEELVQAILAARTRQGSE